MMATATARPSYAQATRTLLRERLLDAADALLRERAWASISMADIAGGAGVSRQTLYNEIGSREDFAQAYILRESDRFLATVEEAVCARLDDPHAALRAAFEVFLSAAAENQLIQTVLAGDGSDGLLALFTTHGAPVLALGTERLAAILTCGWPQVRIADLRLLADALVRLAISHAALPAGAPEHSAATVSKILGPYVDRLLAQAPR
ncbi:MAG TPA: TetR family transcriptional regulator [Solirubrobacteraceae bacterium]|jgi:AcrR family transcriptional regulator